MRSSISQEPSSSGRRFGTKVQGEGSARGLMFRVVVLCCFAFVPACADKDLAVDFFRSETYTFSSSEQRAIERIAHSALSEVRPLLPALPAKIHLTVRPGTDVNEETGETASAMPPDAIIWTVDPGRHGGVTAITRQWLRATLFHELHHLARSTAAEPRSIVDHALYEGMATAFERDFADVRPPWGAYPDNVHEWARELNSLPENAPRRDWIYSHPDGRRWIGIKVGTYWVDQAIARSKRTSADFCTMQTRDVLALAAQ